MGRRAVGRFQGLQHPPLCPLRPGAGCGPSQGPGQAPAALAHPPGGQKRWPRSSPAASQGGAGQPQGRRQRPSRGLCASRRRSREGQREAAAAAAGAAPRDQEKTPGVHRRRRGTAGQRWRGLAPPKRGTGWSKTGSPRYWALNLPRKKRERVTQAFIERQRYAQLHTRY